MDRVADGATDQSSPGALVPRPDRVEERFSATISGRKLDQGILARVALDESHVKAMHKLKQTETVRVPVRLDVDCDFLPDGLGKIASQLVTNCASERLTTSLGVAVQEIEVPEISQAKVDGEWLIPNEGVLLVSLGIETVADEKGMAGARERVAVIGAGSIAMSPVAEPARVDAALPPVPYQYSRLPMPPAPARSMPEPLDPNGNLVDLPPLPEAVASADLDRIKPAPNQPSPQTPVFPSPSSAVPDRDSELARTSFDAGVPVVKRPPSATWSDAQAQVRLLERAIEALEKASVGIDVDVLDVDFKELRPSNGGCEAARSAMPTRGNARSPRRPRSRPGASSSPPKWRPNSVSPSRSPEPPSSWRYPPA
jgi:hypothetical protein